MYRIFFQIDINIKMNEYCIFMWKIYTYMYTINAHL